MKRLISFKLAAAVALGFAAFGAQAAIMNGITTNGITQNGITTNGITQNGITTNGITQNGITTNGIMNGVTSNGIFNGLGSNGAVRCDGESQHPLCRHDAIRGLSERPLGLQRRADTD